ncbi:hypothetical protein NL676_020696 [Syzygium grande]|nr:hypothetical protein NL676_020696 [Syzygium grande]
MQCLRDPVREGGEESDGRRGLRRRRSCGSSARVQPPVGPPGTGGVAECAPCFSPAAISGHHHHEFRFMEDDVVASAQDSSDGGISFLSWRLNVMDRPSLVHDFTR